MRRLLLAALLLLPALALADVDPRFARLRDTAEPLGGLGAFLDKYIGECASLFSGPSCRSSAEAFRKKYEGKKLYMIVGEGAATMVNPGPYQPGSGNYTIHVNPVFPGDGYVLTHGAPTQTDSAGNPVRPQLSLTGTTPAGWSAIDFMRLFSNRQVRAQVIFTPQGTWSLDRTGGKLHGVSARVDAIRLTHARTGQELGLWFAEAPASGGKKGRKK